MILFGYPQFGGFFPAGGTGFALAGMRDPFDVGAGWICAVVLMISSDGISTAEEFDNAASDAGS